MTYLDSWGSSEQGTCTSMQKVWFENLTLFWHAIDLTSVKSQVGWRHSAKWLSPSIFTCKMTQKTCVAWYLHDFYFVVTFCDLTLTLTLCNYALRPYAVSFVDISAVLWVSVDLLSARLTDPRAQKLKTHYCDLWPDLDLTRDLNLKILSMD